MLEFLLVSHVITDVSQDSSPPGKNQSACWMMGSMMPTICRDKVVIISVMFLGTKRNTTELQQDPHVTNVQHAQCLNTYGSVWVQSKFGPRTIAMLPGVILLASWYSLSLAKNLMRYLWGLHEKEHFETSLHLMDTFFLNR